MREMEGMPEALLKSLPPMIKISLFQLPRWSAILCRANTQFPPDLKSIHGAGYVYCPSLLSDQVNIRYLILSLPFIGYFVVEAEKTVYLGDSLAKDEEGFQKLQMGETLIRCRNWGLREV